MFAIFNLYPAEGDIMLSKTQARWFFILGTGLFSLIFVFLTVDTINKIPAQTNSENLTEEVVLGQKIWTDNNCMGCHTLLGEGAYYAPELTKTYERRGPEWLKVFLKDPQAMYPGERKMVQYDFTDQEMDYLIAFFKWIGEMDLNNFPPEPDLKQDKTVVVGNTASQLEQPKKFKTLCMACHAVGGKGGIVGPPLDGVGSRLDEEFLDHWIKDPSFVKPGTTMPKLPISDLERKDIVTYLLSLKGANP